MSCKLTLGALAASAMLVAGSADAGVYADDLGKCLVKATNIEDRTELMQWMFAVMSVNPSVKPLSNITPLQRDGYDVKMADLVQRLLVKDCRAEAVEALKNEGTGVFDASFRVLGQAAMQGLMNDPGVAAALETYGKRLDNAKFKELGNEAGISSAIKPAK